VTVELRGFLEARIAEDEEVARALVSLSDSPGEWRMMAGGGIAAGSYELLSRYSADQLTSWHLRHIVRHDPARVLRDVEAKRRLLAQHQAVCDEVRSPKSAEHRMNARARQFALDEVLATLALPYSDHPDYNPSWTLEATT
jgi:hypothetical protein